jgi:hypothetical protein
MTSIHTIIVGLDPGSFPLMPIMHGIFIARRGGAGGERHELHRCDLQVRSKRKARAKKQFGHNLQAYSYKHTHFVALGRPKVSKSIKYARRNEHSAIYIHE